VQRSSPQLPSRRLNAGPESRPIPDRAEMLSAARCQRRPRRIRRPAAGTWI